MAIESLVHDAFTSLGVASRVPTGANDGRVDLVLEPDGIAVEIQLMRRALLDDQAADRLLKERPESKALLMVVGDRVTEGARRRLMEAGVGYLDLRGRLGLRAGSIVINADVPAINEQHDRTDALAGKAGLEVATRLLMTPTAPAAVRALARELGRSPSTVSALLGALRRDGLIDSANTVTDTALFWRVAEKWPTRRTYVATVPTSDERVTAQALRLGLDDVETASGWALTDTAAATAFGAPVAFRYGQQLDFLVPDLSVLQRAIRLLGSADSATSAPVSIRVAPVPIAVNQRVAPRHGSLSWPLVHPLFVALDLAQDTGRGREILDAWTPQGEGWARVW